MDKIIIDLDVTKTCVYKKIENKKEKTVEYCPLKYKEDGKETIFLKNTLSLDDNNEIVLLPFSDAYLFGKIGIFDFNSDLYGNYISKGLKFEAFMNFIRLKLVKQNKFEVIFLLSKELNELLSTSVLSSPTNVINKELFLKDKIDSYNNGYQTNIIFKGCILKNILKLALAEHIASYNKKSLLIYNENNYTMLNRIEKAGYPGFCLDRYFEQWNNDFDIDRSIYLFQVGKKAQSNPLNIKYHYLELKVGSKYNLEYSNEEIKDLVIRIHIENAVIDLKNGQHEITLDQIGTYIILLLSKDLNDIYDVIVINVKEELEKEIMDNSNVIKIELNETYDFKFNDDFTTFRQIHVSNRDGQIISGSIYTPQEEGLEIVNVRKIKYNYSNLEGNNALINELKSLNVGLDNSRYHNLLRYIFTEMKNNNEDKLIFDFQDEKLKIDCSNIIEKQNKDLLDKLELNNEVFDYIKVNKDNTYTIVAIENPKQQDFINNFLTSKGFKVSKNKGYKEINNLLLIFADLIIEANDYSWAKSCTVLEDTVHMITRSNPEIKADPNFRFNRFLFDFLRYYSLETLISPKNRDKFFLELDNSFKKISKKKN